MSALVGVATNKMISSVRDLKYRTTIQGFALVGVATNKMISSVRDLKYRTTIQGFALVGVATNKMISSVRDLQYRTAIQEFTILCPCWCCHQQDDFFCSGFAIPNRYPRIYNPYPTMML